MTREEKVEYLRSKGIGSYHRSIESIRHRMKKCVNSVDLFARRSNIREVEFYISVILALENDLEIAYGEAAMFHYHFINFDEQPLPRQLKILFRKLILRKTGDDIYKP